MKEIADVLITSNSSRAERVAAQKAFLEKRGSLWNAIRDGRFPVSYTSAKNKRFTGAPRRTAIRCDFLLASKISLGANYAKDRIADAAQRDLLFYILRYREVFPNRTGTKFYCCPKCTSKVHECVSANVFRYIDNARWKAEIETAP